MEYEVSFIKFIRVSFSIFIVFGLISSSILNAKEVQVAGTKIAIEPPSEFTASAQFPGFQHKNSGSSIMITEIPGPIENVSRGMTKEGLASRGMTLIEKNKIVVNKQNANLLKISQHHGGVEYLKWMILFGDSSSSVLIVGTFPASADIKIGKKIKKSILTFVWNKEATVDFFDGLSFKIGESSELKYAKRMANMVILGREGEFGKAGVTNPVLIAGSSISQTSIDNLKAFSKQRLLDTKNLEEIVVIEERSFKVDGNDAYEIIADAKDSTDKIPVVIYQVIIPKESNYFIVQGMVGKLISKSYLEQFSQLASNITIE